MNRRLFLGTFAAVVVFLASAWPTRASMVDDAYVSLRYARNLALGHGLTYNAGGAAVEGYTNFLWVVWMAPGTVLPLHPSTWATGWGLAFGAAGLFCATGLAATQCAPGSSWPLLPAWALAVLPVYGIAATNGLETAMYVALLLGAAWATLDGRRPALGGGLAGLLYLVRPEGIAAAGVLVLAGGYLAWRANRGRAVFHPAIAAIAVTAPYFVARAAWFGTWGPNTFAAQARDPFVQMFSMNARYYSMSAGLYGGAALLLLLALVRGPRTLPRLALLAIAAGLSLVAMRVFNWMPGARLFLAPIAVIFVLAAPTFEHLPTLPRRAFGAAFAAWIGWLAFGPSAKVERTYDIRNTALPGNPAEQMGLQIAALAPPGAWLLARDAGVVPYYAGPDVNVIDIHPYSLTDPALTGKPFDRDHVLAPNPAFLVTTAMTEAGLPSSYATERTLLGDPRVNGHYTRTRDANQHYRRWYALWVRDDLLAPTPAPAEPR